MKSVATIPKKGSSVPQKPAKKSFTVVAIGASLGGLEAITALLKVLPPDTGMAFIYVQHLNPDHKSNLPDILSRTTKMKVEVIEDMELMKPDHLYVIPHNKGIKVTDGHIKLIPRAKSGKAISIDVLFSSLAATHKENVMGVVLSGSANDGTLGLKSIKEAGGLTFAQDDSAQAGSMPESAIAAGVVDFILPPGEIALELARNSKPAVRRRSVKEKRKKNNTEVADPNLKTIFEILHKDKGVDFSHYKIATINRRMEHRMQQCKIQTTKEYIKLLSGNKNETALLCKDLLINVTSFFRDPETFRYLKTTLLPKLLKSKKNGETLRVWVPACSTGQEAYSIAMLITEIQDGKTKKVPVKIFATDLSEHVIQDARLGNYSEEDIEPIPKKTLNRFFTQTGKNYLIAKEIREMCVFAPHNILSDPPFFRIDLISCRNLLIYFGILAQQKVLATMHFALNETGYLMLGKSETIGSSSKLYTQLNNKFKIYSRKKNTGKRPIPELLPPFPAATVPKKNIISTPRKIAAISSAALDNAIDSALLLRYMPACAIINKDMEILQFRGLTSVYLSHPSGGKASLNIFKMMRPEFAVELRSAINQALKTKQFVNKPGIEITIDATVRTMTLEVCPLKITWDEPLLLIVFTLQEPVEKFVTYGKNTSGGRDAARRDRRIKMLTEALNAARAEIDSVIESQEAAYEELQGANEEIVSTNEEFQTLNEELETSKEEVEATNEELSSSNQELKTHNELLSESYDYSEAIIATVHEPLLILNGKFEIKSANQAFYKKFHVKQEETEGVSVFELGNKQWDIPLLHHLLEEINLKNIGFHDFEVTHTFPIVGEKIMLLNAHRIIQKAHKEHLILLAIADVTEMRNLVIEIKEKENKALAEGRELERIALKKVEESEARYRNLIQNLPVAVYTCDKEGSIRLYNKAAAELWGREPKIGTDKWTGSSKLFKIDGSPLALDKSPMAMALNGKHVAPGEEEVLIERSNGSRSHVVHNPQILFDENGKFAGGINTIIDITSQKITEKELKGEKEIAEKATGIAEEAVKAKQQFLSNMSHEIRTPMNAIIGFTKVILKTDLTPKQTEYLSAIKMSGDALIVLINDILDLAKVDAGKMTFEMVPFKMDLSISAMVHLFETKIQEKNLELVKEYDPKIPKVLVGDPVRLHQVILNLLSNAVKFTSVGKITMRVRLLKEDEQKAEIEFSVSDTGIGIPDHKIENIFENFQQASSGTARLYGGTGLGLAIVKQLVESQGGSVTVKSKQDEGSTFSCTLSFQKTTEVVEPEKETIIAATTLLENKKTRVLVVEDMQLNQLLMKTLLDDFGFECDIASNGKTAIEKLKKTSFDIILMDLQMPEMNGFEATEHIRHTLKLNIPIIALTADVTTVDMAKCKAIGMNDYVPKPVDDKLLYSKITGLLKRSELSGRPSEKEGKAVSGDSSKSVNLSYLLRHTKSDPALMTQMITLYLEQTPPLVSAMMQSFQDRNWDSLYAAVHKMIPSFKIMGIPSEFETMAKKIQEYAHANNQKTGSASTPEQIHEVEYLVSKLRNGCDRACQELETELNSIKHSKI